MFDTEAAEPRCEVSEGAQGFQYWISREFLDQPTREALGSANVLLVPQEGARDFPGPLFPVETEEVLTFLQEHAPSGVNVDIAIREGDYKELALHGAALIIATTVATLVVAPVVVNLVSEYLKRKLWPNETANVVKFKMAVEDPGSGRAFGIQFEGPAKEFEPSLQAAIRGVNMQVSTGSQATAQNAVPAPRELPPAKAPLDHSKVSPCESQKSKRS